MWDCGISVILFTFIQSFKMNRKIEYFEPEESVISFLNKYAFELQVQEEIRIVNIPENKRGNLYRLAHSCLLTELPDSCFDDNFGTDWYSLRRIV